MPPLEQKQDQNTMSIPTWGSEVIRIKQDMEGLLNHICELQTELEQVQDERNYNVAKANELQAVVESHKSDSIKDECIQKSLQLAEMTASTEKLKSQIKSLRTENHRLRAERLHNRQELRSMKEKTNSLPDLLADSRHKAKNTVTAKNSSWHKEKGSGSQHGMDSMMRKGVGPRHQRASSRERIEKRFPGTSRSTRPAMRKANSAEQLMGPSSNRKSIRMTVRERREAARKSAAVSLPLSSLFTKDSQSTTGTTGEKVKDGNRVVRIGDREGSYVGPMKNGLPNGMGTIRFSNGDTYLGQVVDGRMHGKGTIYHRSKELGVVRGCWQNNEKVES